MASSEFDKPVAQAEFGFENILSICDQRRETDHSMQVLAQLARTLGLPIEAFFEDCGRSALSEDCSAQELAELNLAFLAIVDPSVRQHCLDLVREASAAPSRQQTGNANAD